ncbi:restriction endonuclease subunit S [Acidovorax temperans]|uniref:restriction endonuclease subunit S n=1 Tax=Acidovorax temperans TaxID=80878 RepID=UPI002899A336|nr:restriction endonuclease subunit S [Acidovorax temperans]
MELKPGYKRSDLGPIPEDWDAVPMNQVSECLIGLTYSPLDVSDFGTLVLRSSNIQDGRLAFDDCVFLDMDIPKRAITRKNDILICVRNGSRQLIGKCALIDERTAGSAFGAFMSVLRSESAKFLFFQFQSDLIKRQINEVMGATINQITNRDMASFKVICPPTSAEKEAIAEALSDADALIESLDQLIAKKRQIKQGAMQELLTGKRRLPGFSGEWDAKRLGALLTIRHGKSQKGVESIDGAYPILATGGQIGKTNQFLCDKPSVLIGRKGTIDQPQYMDTPFWTVDTLFYSDIHSKNNAKFLFYRFCLIDWMQYNEASGVPSLNARTIEDVEILCPELVEQTAIAAILSDMDTELAALESRLAKARQIKQGMMQELLTGRIRLL